MTRSNFYTAAFRQICRMPTELSYAGDKALDPGRLESLSGALLRFSFFNLLLVALMGLLLRSFPFLPEFPLLYKNILHGHSHFAFGGWVMPMMVSLFLKYFPDLAEKTGYRHWRMISFLLLGSAYGMMLSFPVQGYGPVSVCFSTLSMAAGYYMVFVVFKALKGREGKTSDRWIRWALIYFALSTAGPLATGPLIAMGYQGTPLYYNAIYFYLHFQYNGFFTFFVLALLYRLLENKGQGLYGKKVFLLFNGACIPTCLLSVLWSQPPVLLNIIGGTGALLQVAGWMYLLKDLRTIRPKPAWIRRLLFFSFLSFSLKIGLQLFSAWPALAIMAYHHRNLVIAYLHLVLLGFISVSFFAAAWASFRQVKVIQYGLALFMVSFLFTESLLVAHALSVTVPFYAQWLFGFSIFFPLGILAMNAGIRKNLRGDIEFRGPVRVFG